jgi:hypothetical protein
MAVRDLGLAQELLKVLHASTLLRVPPLVSPVLFPPLSFVAIVFPDDLRCGEFPL